MTICSDTDKHDVEPTVFCDQLVNAVTLCLNIGNCDVEELNLITTQRQVIKFEYQMSPRTSLNAVRDQNGGFSFETRFRKRW